MADARAEIQELVARAAESAAQVSWAVDMTLDTAGPLLGSGQDVRYVPGRLVNRMAGAFAAEGKTDAKDARTIAESARLRADLPPLTGAASWSPICRH